MERYSRGAVCRRLWIALPCAIAVFSAAPGVSAGWITIQFVNRDHLPAAAVRQFERAAEMEAAQLSRWWHTPPVRFRAHGWKLEVVNRHDRRLGKHLFGWHAYRRQPYALVGHTRHWTRTASHELMEMIVNPTDRSIRHGYLQDVCDPVRTLSYRLRGVMVSDFVTPAWFAGPPGPYDLLSRVQRAQSLRFGFAIRYSPGSGYRIVGTP